MRYFLGDFSWFKNGTGLLPLVEEVMAPDLKWKTEDYTGGGLMGTRSPKTILDKMEIKVKCAGHDPAVTAGFGLMPGMAESFKLVSSLVDPGQPEVPQKILFTGTITEVKRDAYKAGKQMVEHTITDLTYYEEWQDGKEVIAIDLLNQVLRVNGVDVMAQRRRNLGK